MHKYKTYDGRGSRKKKPRPKKKPVASRHARGQRADIAKLKGYDITVTYAGLSVKGYDKIRGPKSFCETELKRLKAKYRRDTSVAFVDVKKVY